MDEPRVYLLAFNVSGFIMEKLLYKKSFKARQLKVGFYLHTKFVCFVLFLVYLLSLQLVLLVAI